MLRSAALVCLGFLVSCSNQPSPGITAQAKPVAADTDSVGTMSDALVKETLATPIESQHPYAPGTVKKWKIKAPNCTSHFRVHFKYIDTEEGYDFVRLTDAAGNKVKSYTGFYTGWSPDMTGAEATLELIADESTQGDGFLIDAIEYGWTGDDQVVWTNTPLTGVNAVSTDHNYKDSETRKWTIQGPVGATKMRLHFKNFATESRYDIVALHSADMTQIATYSGALGDFVSAEVPGDVVIIRMVSDPSVNDYGFDLDSFDAEQAAPIAGACPSTRGCLQITPNNYDFGNVKLTCSAPATIEVFNNCSFPVAFIDASLPTTSEFTLSNVPSTGFNIAAGGTVTFDAQYVPADLGADNAIISVVSDENGVNHTYQVSVTGIGDSAGRMSDDFVQQAPANKSDILLVIDDSGSMFEEQTSLAANFASFIAQAQFSNSDFHIAVTTTSTDQAPAGAFVSDPTTNPDVILTPSSPNLASQFAAKVFVDTWGSGTETCLEASHLALTQPLIGGVNSGFLRSDASLAVVCISDALEQSLQPVKFYTDELINLKGANLVSYNVIGPFTPDSATCTTDSGMVDDGRLAEAVSSTGGVQESICTPDWSGSLAAIGKAAAGFRTQFTLTSEALAPVSVSFDGVAVPEFDAQGNANWVIDNTAKTITFTQTSAPTAGQALHIEYSVSCQ